MMEQKNDKPKHLHGGHRQRMRTRFDENGAGGFTDHELLEMILFQSIPRGNTNDIAHDLLERFGTLERVVHADIHELQKVDGIGEIAAFSLVMTGELFLRIAKQSMNRPKNYNRTEDLIGYLQHQFVGETTERAYLLLLDNGLKILDCICLSEGTVNAVHVEPRGIAEYVLRRDVSAIVLAHNHPDGIAIPSEEDINITYRLKSFLDTIKVTLLEHFVFAGDRYLPILEAHENILRKPDYEPHTVKGDFYSTYVKKYEKK